MISIGDALKVFDWIKGKLTSRQHRHELEQGLAMELHELRFTVANALLQLRMKLRDFDQTTLDLIRPIHLLYKARGANEAQIVSAFKQLLSNGDSELIKYVNAYPGDPSRALRPSRMKRPF